MACLTASADANSNINHGSSAGAALVRCCVSAFSCDAVLQAPDLLAVHTDLFFRDMLSNDDTNATTVLERLLMEVNFKREYFDVARVPFLCCCCCRLPQGDDDVPSQLRCASEGHSCASLHLI